MLSRIVSISARTSGVSLGSTLSASRFAVTCSGLDAPRMTVLTLGLLAAQARARAACVHPSFVATLPSLRTFSSLALPSCEAARQSSEVGGEQEGGRTGVWRLLTVSLKNSGLETKRES